MRVAGVVPNSSLLRGPMLQMNESLRHHLPQRGSVDADQSGTQGWRPGYGLSAAVVGSLLAHQRRIQPTHGYPAHASGCRRAAGAWTPCRDLVHRMTCPSPRPGVPGPRLCPKSPASKPPAVPGRCTPASRSRPSYAPVAPAVAPSYAASAGIIGACVLLPGRGPSPHPCSRLPVPAESRPWFGGRSGWRLSFRSTLCTTSASQPRVRLGASSVHKVAGVGPTETTGGLDIPCCLAGSPLRCTRGERTTLVGISGAPVGSVGVARAVDRIARPSQRGEDEGLPRTIAASR